MTGRVDLVVAACVAVLIALALTPWTPRAPAGRLGRLSAASGLPRGGTGSDRGGRRRGGGHGRGGADDAAIGTGGGPLGVAMVLDLLDAAMQTGVSLPRALAAVGAAIGGSQGRALRAAAAQLLLGASWATAWDGLPQHWRAVPESLEPCWRTGAAAGPLLRAASARARRESQRAAQTAAARLGVHLVLPLGLCFLPAFVAVGVVPVIISLGSGLLGPR